MNGLIDVIPKVEKTGWPWVEETDPAIYIEREWPKISIVTPSFNQGAFIEETIRSVLLQNYPNLEFIIIDGGSSDKTVDIIKKYNHWINYWVSEKDCGQSDAINKGFSRCSGRIMNWLNSDDILLPGSLYKIALYDWQEDTGALVGRGHKVDLKKNIIYSPPSKELGFYAFLRWMDGNNFMQPACFFSRVAWEKCGPVDQQLKFCMDVDLWLKISSSFRFERLDADVAYAYTHDSAKTTAQFLDACIETCFLVNKYGYTDLAIAQVKKIFARKEKYPLLKILLRKARLIKRSGSV